MIACPTCGGDTGVLETRDATAYVRRRRICKNPACGTKVTTVEVVLQDANRRREGAFVMVRRVDVLQLFEIASRMIQADPEAPCPE